MGRDAAPSALEAVSARYREFYQQARRPVEGAPALLRALRGKVAVGIVSNNHTVEQQDKLAATGMRALIDFLLTSEDAGAEAGPEIFDLALERGGARRDEAVMVGDTWGTDIVGARAAGIRSFWLNRSGRAAARPDRRGRGAPLAATGRAVRDGCSSRPVPGTVPNLCRDPGL